MKTTKETREFYKKWSETRSYKSKEQSLPRAYLDLLDDLDTLEAKCEWQIGIIERMKPWLVGHEEFPEFAKLKADLERGPVG